MASLNKVQIIGYLGQDPETRYLPNGGAVTNISVATSERWKDKNTGEDKERTEWHRIVFYNRLAEVAAEYLRKGSQVYVEGKNQTRSWEQDGIKRYATEIIANEMQMLDRQGGGQGGSSGGQQPQQRGNTAARTQTHPGNKSQQPSPPPGMDGFDDDIPF